MNTKVGRPRLKILEKDIRYAMVHCQSYKECAIFLGCTVTSFKYYASLYIDSETGLTLLELIKKLKLEKSKIKKKQLGQLGPGNIKLYEILDGKHPRYNRRRLVSRLFTELVFKEECQLCGYDEKRLTDYKAPLTVIWKDRDIKNHKKENLEILCYNCAHNMYGQIFKSWRFSPYFIEY